MFTAALTALDLAGERMLERQEGLEIFPYDDATGKRVRAPVGNISWGFGFNLEECGARDLFEDMLTSLIRKIETQLQAFAWYAPLPSAVQSAVLDIAYNAGVGGLLHYPRMIAALEAKDYAGAAAQCQTSNPELQTRYAQLRALIASAAGSPASAPPPAAA
jgi:GH24 family phage-related lysozyme (muramidase)